MKDGWMNANDWTQWTSFRELNESYETFLRKDYTNEVHSSLGMTPKERFMQDINLIKFVEKEELDQAFLNRTTRKVSATATVSIFNTEYELPGQFIGMRKLELRYDPFDTSKVYVYQNGKRTGQGEPVRKVENARRKRKVNIPYANMDGGKDNV